MTTTTIQRVETKSAEMVGKWYERKGVTHRIDSARVKGSRFILSTDKHEFDIDLVNALRLLGEFKETPAQTTAQPAEPIAQAAPEVLAVVEPAAELPAPNPLKFHQDLRSLVEQYESQTLRLTSLQLGLSMNIPVSLYQGVKLSEEQSRAIYRMSISETEQAVREAERAFWQELDTYVKAYAPRELAKPEHHFTLN